MHVLNDLSYKIIGAIFNVYNGLGPGLLENIYEAALIYELQKAGLDVKSQVVVPVFYDNKVLPVEYRIDLLVENSIIVELKSVKELLDVHHKQLITYLRIANKPLGLLVNFNTADIKSAIHRKINTVLPTD